MDHSNSAKTPDATAPQLSEMKDGTPSTVVRHLGLIKAMAIIMAVLIVAALAIIVITIYGRLTVANGAKSIQKSELVIPVDSRVTSASLGDKGDMLLVIENKAGQQLWRIDPAGKIWRKMLILQSQ
jgi:hypothetical protein